MRRAVRRIWMVAAVIGVGVGLVGCGGGGGGSGVENELLSVRDAQGFPNGKFLPLQPSPATLNQCLWIELTAEVDPATVFDATTGNGLGSGVRCLNFYYEADAATVTPLLPLVRERLSCIPVLNGLTNFDATTKTFRPTADIPVTNAALGIPPNIPLRGDRANYLILVADSDGDLTTYESFLPRFLRANSAKLQNSQIMVNLTAAVKSVRGRALDPEFVANFIVGNRDQIPPVVDSVVPAPGATNVAVDTTLLIRFSEPIDASSFQPAGFGDPVPSLNTQVNFQLAEQYMAPGQSTPQLVNNTSLVTPTSGQTTSLLVTPFWLLYGNNFTIVNIYSAASTLAGASPYHPAVTDPAGNPLAPNSFTDGAYTFTSGAGPRRANNPIDPECVHVITSTSGLGTVRVSALDRAATGFEDVVQEVNQSGELSHFIPGGLQDGVVGPWIARLLGMPGSGRNRINDPPRQCQYWLQGFAHRGNPGTTTVVLPGKYTPPEVMDDILCTATMALPSEPPPTRPQVTPPNYCPESITPGYQNRQHAEPYGVYLFVTNEAENVVHCVSSHLFVIIKDLRTPDPRGVSISPDMSFLYVSNFGANSLSVLDVTAGPDGLPKGELVRLIPVGSGPQGVAAQPNGEDILVCNRLGKTVSVIAVSDLGNPGDPVRVTLQAGDPYEVSAGARLTNLLLPYYAYITNPTTNEIVIFEAGPPQINGFGRDQVINIIGSLKRPTGICSDQWFNTSTYQNPVPFNDSMTGAFVVMAGDGTVVHLKATRFSIPAFPNPPPALVEARFEITTTYRVGENPYDVSLDNNVLWCSTPEGKFTPYIDTRPNPPITASVNQSRLYVSNGDGTISVIEVRSGREVLRLKANGARRMFNYYKQ